MDKLTEYGLKPKRCGHGVTASLGTGGKTLLLRADMDALPMEEESGESFACPTGTEAHACGHDFHAAMLLTAAKMLKENEMALKGTARFYRPHKHRCPHLPGSGGPDRPGGRPWEKLCSDHR